jgi:hypothetical protein
MTKWLIKHIRTKDPSKLSLRNDMFTLTLLDLQYETSVSISEFGIMIVLKW